ncbi:GNAT family N-acetyltransferase [Romboutsia sp. CE17]|uniref:GNAT family N-acetyltransferase n=1 Tax=Romboutsia sp. CE17 TaxID=2724150 RepID=UPI001442B6CB|nr:GNAT family N-acetyltransferase [Romboutsia sp. CE17]QJA08839.1 GNAT family N-acetyltransferase [Romboutsia sp. CE17]
MIKSIQLSKFNGNPCENLLGNICYITKDKFEDVINLFNRVNSSMDNKSWLKSRDVDYLQGVLDKNGFIVGCYIEDTLVASALCEAPQGEYKDMLIEIGMNEYEIENTFISGFVMVDPFYRGNALHRTLLETRIDLSIKKGIKNIVTVVNSQNIYSLNTILNLGFEIKLEKENEDGIIRYVLYKNLENIPSTTIEITA